MTRRMDLPQAGMYLPMMGSKPIFFDASGRRAARIKVIAWVVGIAAVVILTGFVTSLLLSPPVSGLDLPGRAAAAPNLAKNLERRAQKPGLLARAERLAGLARKRRLDDIAKLRRAQGTLPSRVLPAILKPQAGRPLAIGFYTNWAGRDDPSWPSLKRSLKNLDWVVPLWLTLDGPDLKLRSWLEHRSLDFIHANKPDVAILPMVQNVTAGKWNGEGLAKLLADRKRSDALLDQIIAFVAAGKFQGVTVDFEEVPKAAHKDLEGFSLPHVGGLRPA